MKDVEKKNHLEFLTKFLIYLNLFFNTKIFNKKTYMIRKFLRKLIFMLSRDLKILLIENNLFDLKRLDYNYSIFNIYNRVKNVPGHILELGTGTAVQFDFV